jgi:C-terminal processing protease CtpA/Prc
MGLLLLWKHGVFKSHCRFTTFSRIPKTQRDLLFHSFTLVVKVVDDSPADKAGVRPGDVIVEFIGYPVEDTTEIALLIGKTKIGTNAQIVLNRTGTRLHLYAAIQERPASADGTY